MNSVSGVIVGGQEYVWAAYIITWTSLALYGASLWWRARKAAEDSARSDS